MDTNSVFYPFSGFSDIVFILIPAHYAAAIQADCTRDSILLHHTDAHHHYLLIPQNQWLRPAGTERTKKALYSLYPHHHLLYILPADDAQAEYPLVYDRYHTGGVGCSGYLYCSQPEMETERTHGRYRRHHRRVGFIQRAIRIQPRVVVVPVHPDCRSIGVRTDYTETSFAGRSTIRFYRRTDMRIAGIASVEQCIVPDFFILNPIFTISLLS